MVPGSYVVTSEGKERQLWVGHGHEHRAQRQADTLNKQFTGFKVVPVWIERPLNNKEKRNAQQQQHEPSE